MAAEQKEYTPDGLAGMNMAQISEGLVSCILHREENDFRSSPETLQFSSTLRHKNGADLPFKVSALTFFVIATRDIEDPVEITESQRQSESRYRKFFENPDDATLLLDPQRDRIMGVNDQACRMLGYSLEALLSMGGSEIHPNDMPQLMACAKEVKDKGQGWTNERLSRPSGTAEASWSQHLFSKDCDPNELVNASINVVTS